MSYTQTATIETKLTKITNYLPDLGIENIRSEIINGLISKEKYISSKFFYDNLGSKLFEDITQLVEYYPTRTEKSILRKVSPSLMNDLTNVDIVELGSGDCSKIKLLLKDIHEDNLETINYIPVDVSLSAIQNSTEELSELFPNLTINGLVADFINQLQYIPSKRERLFLFLGSTIGNFTSDISTSFLNNLSSTMNSGDSFLLGVDLVKPKNILHNAYNDKKGITAEFNKNILSVINNTINSNFNIDDFEHKAFFNEIESRIEMHLIAKKEIIIKTPFHDSEIVIKKGENIHTENSYKYSQEMIESIEKFTKLKIKNTFTDEKKWFSLVLFEK
jgi:L-histidine N-alpha-methyltransferase